MRFSHLTELFENLEKTSSRTQMTNLLAELFKKATSENIDKICYFTLGEIAAGYKNIYLGLGDEMTKSAIALAAAVDKQKVEEKFKEIGDLGRVADTLLQTKEEKLKNFFSFQKNLSVKDVHRGLMKIATASGSGSQEVKKKTLAAMLADATSQERRYLVRLSTGEMRLGVGDMTILDSLSTAFFGSKDKREELEHAYNVCSDIGYVAKVLARSGLKGVKNIRIALNRPIRPMLTQRVSEMSQIMEKIESEVVAAEEKYDGERIQAHKDGYKVKLYSRRLTDVTSQFPEVVEKVSKDVKIDSAILDGEVVAYDFEEGEYYPFQKLMQRRRKYEVEKYAEKIPVRYMVFDVLYAEGRSWLKRSYPERRKKLEEIVENSEYTKVTGRVKSTELDVIDEFFQNCLNRGLEGIVCKSCSENSYYRAGAREWMWIKWKESYASELSDTLDLVVVGAYAGKGKRGGTYGALLCAAYNHEEDLFQTVCKLGTGFSDEQLENMPHKLGDVQVDSPHPRVMTTKEVDCDYWFTPKYVLEVLGSEITQSPVHTCNWDEKKKRGLALRFPRFKRWRSEKAADQATTVQEIVDMFQRRK
ncbi:MAG: ATP-dependent DNA ligase [Thermoproteota archaeon]